MGWGRWRGLEVLEACASKIEQVLAGDEGCLSTPNLLNVIDSYHFHVCTNPLLEAAACISEGKCRDTRTWEELSQPMHYSIGWDDSSMSRNRNIRIGRSMTGGSNKGNSWEWMDGLIDEWDG